jgi:hypothetical protein
MGACIQVDRLRPSVMIGRAHKRSFRPSSTACDSAASPPRYAWPVPQAELDRWSLSSGSQTTSGHWRVSPSLLRTTTTPRATKTRRHQLRVDFSERHAALLDLARGSGEFDIRLEQLAVGDYLVDEGVIVERKTYADFATSLVDGRLFLQGGCARSKSSSDGHAAGRSDAAADAKRPSARAEGCNRFVGRHVAAPCDSRTRARGLASYPAASSTTLVVIKVLTRGLLGALAELDSSP